MHTTEDYTVRVIDLPYSVGGMIAVDEDDYTSIYINARWPREKQRRAFRHELRHIEGDDIYNAKDIRTVEREADGVPARSSGAPADGWQNDIYLALPLFD